MRQTPVNNIHDATNTQQEPGGNAQEIPRSPPEVLGQVPQPTSMTSTRMLGQMETAPATWLAHENELADTLVTTNHKALSPRTGIYDTTPMTPEHRGDILVNTNCETQSLHSDLGMASPGGPGMDH